MAFGVSFLPTQQENGPNSPRGSGPGVTPLQEAIKILSLRLPKRAPGSFIPAPLLNAPGGGNVLGRSALGQTQQQILPTPSTPPMARGPMGSVTGASSPGSGGPSPRMWEQVLQILAGGAPAGPPPTPRIDPRDEERFPTPTAPSPAPSLGGHISYPPPLRYPGGPSPEPRMSYPAPIRYPGVQR